MNSDKIPNGVVLDEPLAHALLYVGVREHLLDDDPTIGDGFVRRLMNSPPDQRLIDNAFEHLVLSGKIYIPFWLPREWKGQLIEQSLIVPTELVLEKDLIEAPGLSLSLALAMLHDRGHAWSQEFLIQKYDEFMMAYRAWEATGSKSFEGLEIRMILKDLFPIAPEEYSSDELAAWKRANEAYLALRPVLDCHKAYRKILTSSLQNSALSALPLDVATISAKDLPLIETSADRTILLRIACKKMRRVPIGSNLCETIKMAVSPEAQGLRLKLTAWTGALHANKADPVTVVLADIEKARASLQTAKTFSKFGEYSTIIGVPVGVAGLFISGPLIAIGGLAITVIGGAALVGQKRIEGMNKWAMFGQE